MRRWGGGGETPLCTTGAFDCERHLALLGQSCAAICACKMTCKTPSHVKNQVDTPPDPDFPRSTYCTDMKVRDFHKIGKPKNNNQPETMARGGQKK
jgi:hypothetical protein